MSESPNLPAPVIPPAAARWRTARRFLLAVAAVATLVACFYTVENWRGQRAWESRRHALEAMGEVLDWSAYIPPPVPDADNFFKAPGMTEWFVKEDTALISQAANRKGMTPFSPGPDNPREEVDLVLAEARVVLTNNAATDSQGAEVVLRMEDPASRDRVGKLLAQAVGPYLVGPNRGILLARDLEQYRPVRLMLRADSMPNLRELAAFFPTQLPMAFSHDSKEKPYLGVEPAGGDLFRVILKKPVYGAADYLSWTDSLEANFDLVRRALQRPYARIDCDYQQPFAIQIPNFIQLRQSCQVLSQRAQAYLLLGQPEQAFRELALVHGLSKVLLAKPSGKPITLVGAMIHVAIDGLYTQIIRNGLELHAWHEPQLLALEEQLKETNLLTPVAEAFREERAATSRTFETTSRSELVNLFALEGLSKLALRLMPRGWFYQNMAVGAEVEQEALRSLDLTNQLVRPRPVTELVQAVASNSDRRAPYRFLVAVAIPNFAKALAVAAANQTLIQQALIGCALERFRLAQGQYADTLQQLAPHYLEALPHDLITGLPMKYHREAGGGYLLYSVGWDEKDSGGVVGRSREEGDWVWSMP